MEIYFVRHGQTIWNVEKRSLREDFIVTEASKRRMFFISLIFAEISFVA